MKTNSLVKVRPTERSLQMMASGGSISGTIWRSHEIKAYSGLSLRRPVLDLGCGDGRFTKLLFEEPLDIGLDLSSSSIEVAKGRKWHKKFIVSQADKTGLPENSVNSIFSNSVFEHISNLEEVIKEAHRILAPGGDFVFTVHAPDSKNFLISKFLRSINLKNLANKYEYLFTQLLQLNTLWNRKQWTQNLQKNGFQVCGIIGTTPARSAKLYELLMPLTMVQKRVLFLKILPITKILLLLLNINLNTRGDKNYLIKATKRFK